MNNYKNNYILDGLEFLFVIIIGIVSFAVLIMALIASINCILGVLNKSECAVYVDGQNVFNGKCHLVETFSVGQNGNKYEVKIHEDITKFRIKKYYITDKVEIKDITND